MENLRRCPFCGGKAILLTSSDTIENLFIKGYKVECLICHCSPYPNNYGSVNNAIERWNRRYTDEISD